MKIMVMAKEFKMDEKNTKLNLLLSIEEINIILSGLQELPAKICNPLTQKIHEQANEQLKPNMSTNIENTQ